jgi:hypothetical protein
MIRWGGDRTEGRTPRQPLRLQGDNKAESQRYCKKRCSCAYVAPRTWVGGVVEKRPPVYDLRSREDFHTERSAMCRPIRGSAAKVTQCNAIPVRRSEIGLSDVVLASTQQLQWIGGGNQGRTGSFQFRANRGPRQSRTVVVRRASVGERVALPGDGERERSGLNARGINERGAGGVSSEVRWVPDRLPQHEGATVGISSGPHAKTIDRRTPTHGEWYVKV